MSDDSKTTVATDPNDLLNAFFKSAFPDGKVILLIERGGAFEMLKFGEFGPTTALGMTEAGHTAARVDIINQISASIKKSKTQETEDK